MSEPGANPFMVMILEHNNFVSDAEVVEADIIPLDEQQAFGPGDAALLASSNAPLEADFTVVRGLDPVKHTEDFPDWEERMQLRDHVLVELFSRADPELSMGWVHRLKLMPIRPYRYAELHAWRKKGFPEEPPQWVMNIYRKFTDKLSEQAPDKVPVAITCPNCKKRNVELQVTRRLVYTGRAGVMKFDGEERHVPINDPDMNSSHTAILRCMDCHTTADLTDDEWLLPNISN